MIRKTYSFEKNGVVNDVYTLSNGTGAEVDVLTYGARIIRISLPDRKGKFADCVVGFSRAEDYYKDNPCFGGTVGRFANRVKNAQFSLNGQTYLLEKNDGENCLHGGETASFDRVVWDAEIQGDRLVLSHFSPDGAGGFPGNMQVTLTITFSENGTLTLDYQATTDKDTVCNLTNHTYFNLGGQPTILSHELMINADKITPVDQTLVPDGGYMDVEGTPFSFQRAKPIGRDVFAADPILRLCNGYDVNYCLNRIGKGLEHFACVYDPESGRKMDCYTTLPGVQLYTACKMENFTGRGKKRKYENYCALCLETQAFPNSPNCPNYPSAVLKAGETYHEITAFRFSLKKPLFSWRTE